MTGRTVLITGSTDGIGRRAAVRLGAAGTRVLLHGRDAARARATRDEIVAAGGPEPEVLLADLASVAGVDGLAERVRDRTDRLDVLVNNAGVGFGAPGAGRRVGPDGTELRFAVNYLAGYRLTRLLLPLLLRSAPARIVNVASAGQEALDLDDLQLERSYSGVSAYRRSKLAQVMFTFDLAEELRGTGVTVNALHPASLMATTMVRESGHASLSTVEEGTDALLRLIDDPGLADVTGAYFDRTRAERAHPQAYDPAVRRRLREVSDRLAGR
ncbi:SDR family NAD(P)-dependent oxidoreductase [Actinomadura kijaniata]|uniref:SDR family NAD(P)-dependent oxidoreductase n=1 Tax=Actinomadura kijaniata TaxID=46161 RepID=UPI000832E444|nr:SDR family NAD(P)-dependent oxidoreductase [Actinomadura kijaniata]